MLTLNRQPFTAPVIMQKVTIQNNKKYSSSNFLKRWLLGRFLDKIANELDNNLPHSVLDFGCGSAVFWNAMQSRLQHWPATIIAIDSDSAALEQAKTRNIPNSHFFTVIPENTSPIDCIICLEVLEHLQTPGEWLEKLCALHPKNIILSVPHEPWFRICQMLSGNNWSRMGNDQDHVQNWSAHAFKDFVSQYMDITSVDISAFPFTIITGQPKASVH